MEETSKKEILEAIQIFSTNMDKQFSDLKEKMNNGFEAIENRLTTLENDVKDLESKVNSLESKVDSGFATLSAEIAELKVDLEAKIDALDTRSEEDTCITMRDQIKLESRVKKLEQQMSQLQPA